jgi:hypothetical protein
MLMSPKEVSRLIRMKKKKMMNAEPELVDTDAKPDMNPNDMEREDRMGRIEHTLDTPEKINAMDTDMAMSDDDAMTMGLTAEEKGRMKRLRAYIDTLDLSD